MVHCLMTDKENYCALRPQSYELHTVEGVFIPYCISFLLRLIVHSVPTSYELHTVEGVFFIPYCISFSLRLIENFAPHRIGVRTTDSGFYSQFMLLSPPIV